MLPLLVWFASVTTIHLWLAYSDRPLPPGWSEVRLGDSYDRVTKLVGRPAVISDRTGEGVQIYLRDVPRRERVKKWGRILLGAWPSSLRDDVIFARFDASQRLMEVGGTGIELPRLSDSLSK